MGYWARRRIFFIVSLCRARIVLSPLVLREHIGRGGIGRLVALDFPSLPRLNETAFNIRLSYTSGNWIIHTGSVLT